MNRKLATILFCLLQLPIAGLVFGAWTDCVCSINGPSAGGSGTLVAIGKNGHGLIISAAHVFEDGNNHDITCEFPAVRKKYRAKLLAAQKLNDIAALDIASVPDVERPPAIVAARKADGPFTCVGFPWDSRHQLRSTKGPYVGYELSNNEFSPGSALLTLQIARSGYSGGGRFNRFGEYVGPITGMTGRDKQHMDKCYGVSAKGMLDFVGKFVKVQK